MIESVSNATTWATATFAASSLPDRRLHERLVRYGGAQAQEPAATTSAVCKGDSAAPEGAYRFLENPRVRPEGIEAGPVAKAKADCAGRNVVVMIQDTTSASVKYRPLADEIRSAGSPTGFMVHATLAVDGETGYPIGILDQQRWILNQKERAPRPKRAAQTELWACSQICIVDPKARAIAGHHAPIVLED